MTIAPGSLDYLYYNGVLDHIPYEAYEIPMGNNTSPLNSSVEIPELAAMRAIKNEGKVNNVQMNGSEYLNMATGGNAFQTYTNNDVFVKRNNNNFSQGSEYDLETGLCGQEGKKFNDKVSSGAKSIANSVSNMPSFVKGLISGGVILGTLICLLKVKKAPKVQQPKTNNGMWSKIKNFFKKN